MILDNPKRSRLLGNVLYTGRIRYRGELIQGEHPAIIDPVAFDQVQALLKELHRKGDPLARNQHHALLKGLLVCAPCNCGMTYTWTKRQQRFYAYYTCANSRSRGADTCPMPNLPAADIERLVVDEIKAICSDPRLSGQVLTELAAQQAAERDRRQEEVRQAEADLDQARSAVSRTGTDALRRAEGRLTSARSALASAVQSTISKAEALAALHSFDPVWAELSPPERTRLLRLLVEKVVVDGQAGKVSFVFRAAGLAALAAAKGSA